MIEPSCRKSHQRRQGDNRAQRDGRQAFLPVVEEQVANLFRRESSCRHLVKVDFIFIFVHSTAAGSNTGTANAATADNAINAPLAKEAATGGDVDGDPSMVNIISLCSVTSTPVEEIPQMCKYSNL